jgi:hypothetical protein
MHTTTWPRCSRCLCTVSFRRLGDEHWVSCHLSLSAPLTLSLSRPQAQHRSRSLSHPQARTPLLLARLCTSVEVCLQPSCALDHGDIEQEVRRLIQGGGKTSIKDGDIDLQSSSLLARHVISARVAGLADSGMACGVPFWQVRSCALATHQHLCGTNQSSNITSM